MSYQSTIAIGNTLAEVWSFAIQLLVHGFPRKLGEQHLKLIDNSVILYLGLITLRDLKVKPAKSNRQTTQTGKHDNSPARSPHQAEILFKFGPQMPLYALFRSHSSIEG